ncbi:MAG TPA: hypothetical protein VKB88_36160 [Bryobacteraceae bacterium]|nr:hypothetical protein [Bryobacteraceae bacterium]
MSRERTVIAATQEAEAAARPSPEQVSATLGRILASEEFIGSAQLSRFLRHVVENGLASDWTALKESVIGVAAFNRGPGYDPKTDPIVRVEARRLRERLETYYGKHSAREEVRIALPKGGYCPSFELLPHALAVVEPPKVRLRPIVGILLMVCAAASIAIPVCRSLLAANLVAKFWSPILDGGRPVLVIPADSALVMLQDLAHQPAQLPEYLNGEYRRRLASQSQVSPDIAFNLAGRRYTSIADLEFANRLSHRRESARLGVFTRYARDVRVEDLKRNNLILLGARHSNPWVELYEQDTTIRLQHDERTGVFTVLNTTPGPSETREIVISPADLEHEIYGIITYHQKGGDLTKVLIIAGTSVAGTEAAADFLLDDARLLTWLQKATVHGEVRGFDILLHARNLSGSAPRAEVVAFHADR